MNLSDVEATVRREFADYYEFTTRIKAKFNGHWDIIEDSLQQSAKKLEILEQRERELLWALANRAYLLEHGKAASGAADLVPEYLPENQDGW